MTSQPIALFDSGFGGLTVMQEVAKLLPRENLIYLGDTAHLPYGNKSPQTIIRFTLENGTFLVQKGIKLLIIACHTACCHALSILQQKLPIPVIGIVQSGLDLAKDKDRIAILATTSTIESGVYQSLIQKQNPQATLFPQACPLFVPLIEEGFNNHLSMRLIAESYLSPLMGKIDAALLACTHYPLARSVFAQVLGPKVALLEPAANCALEAQQLLEQADLLNSQTDTPLYQFYVTDDPEKFRKLGEIFLGSRIETVEKKLPFAQ